MDEAEIIADIQVLIKMINEAVATTDEQITLHIINNRLYAMRRVSQEVPL